MLEIGINDLWKGFQNQAGDGLRIAMPSLSRTGGRDIAMK
jgi:hypothetical protein